MRRKRLLAILATLALTVSVPGTATALTDPLTETVDSTTESTTTTVEETANSLLDGGDDEEDSSTDGDSSGDEGSGDEGSGDDSSDPVQEVQKTVEETTQDPVGTVQTTVETVEDAANELLGGGDQTPPDDSDPEDESEDESDTSDPEEEDDDVSAASQPSGDSATSSTGPVARSIPSPSLTEGMSRVDDAPAMPRTDAVSDVVRQDTGNLAPESQALADPGDSEESSVVAAPIGGEHAPGQEATRTLVSIFALLLVGGGLITWKLTWDRVKGWES